jgi:oxygen-independent coproporphyrinogen-3 oxidase
MHHQQKFCAARLRAEDAGDAATTGTGTTTGTGGAHTGAPAGVPDGRIALGHPAGIPRTGDTAGGHPAHIPRSGGTTMPNHALRRTAPTDADDPAAPLALYIHVPFCRTRCAFCPFYLNPTRPGFSAEYTALLRRDIAGTAARIVPQLGKRTVNAVFFGGGTPSDLDAADLAVVLRQLRDSFPFAADAEVTVEGRVRGFTTDKAAAWLAAGANRFSLGIQTTDTALRRRMGRLADRDELRTVLAGVTGAATAAGGVVVCDLIYGFPTQTATLLVEDVRFLAEETALAGLDLYELRDFPNSPLAQAVAAGRLPPPVTGTARDEMLTAANLALLEHRFDPFYDRHWRRDPRERSIYNQLAKNPATDLLPLGAGAGGRWLGTPTSRPRNLEKYAAEVASAL